MGGANTVSVVGAGYVLQEDQMDEPLVTIKETGAELHICQRQNKGENWKKIVAVTRDDGIADAVVVHLRMKEPV